MGDLLDLAREAAALPGWRWMPGMRGRDVACRGFLLVALHHSGGAIVVPDGAITTLPVTAEFMARCLPDLADPATLGCLLALVREAYGVGRVWCLPRDFDVDPWRVHARPVIRAVCLGRGSTEAHALVAALRAAGGWAVTVADYTVHGDTLEEAVERAVALGLATADIPAGADVYVHVLAWTPAQAAFGFEFARFLTGEGAPGQPRLGRARGAVLYGQMVLTSDLEIDP